MGYTHEMIATMRIVVAIMIVKRRRRRRTTRTRIRIVIIPWIWSSLFSDKLSQIPRPIFPRVFQDQRVPQSPIDSGAFHVWRMSLKHITICAYVYIYIIDTYILYIYICIICIYMYIYIYCVRAYYS